MWHVIWKVFRKFIEISAQRRESQFPYERKVFNMCFPSFLVKYGQIIEWLTRGSHFCNEWTFNKYILNGETSSEYWNRLHSGFLWLQDCAKQNFQKISILVYFWDVFIHFGQSILTTWQEYFILFFIQYFSV